MLKTNNLKGSKRETDSNIQGNSNKVAAGFSTETLHKPEGNSKKYSK